jgi:hypothetical protein
MFDTDRRGGWLWWLVLGVATAGVLAYLFGAHDRSLAGTVIQAVVAVVALVASIAGWLWRRQRTRRALPTMDGLDRAADALAVAVRVQWEQAAGDRRLLYPARLPVRWRWSTLPVSGQVVDAVDGAGGWGLAPLPGLARVTAGQVRDGGLAELFGVYGGLDSGRLLVLGGAGAGKSSAAIMLVLDALAHRAGLADRERAATPVPVLLTVHGWDPAHRSVVDWLAERLATDYPFLGSADHGPEATAGLVRQARVALLLDGLDELPESLRPVALRALDEQATTLRLVVLTRSQEMIDAAGSEHLHRAAAVELQPVAPAQAAAYLGRCRVHPPPPGWQRLIDHVREAADSPVTRALDTPLMLALVRDTLTSDAQVDALLNPGRFSAPEQVQDELLDQVVPAAYAARPGQPPARYTAEQAERWLGFVAYRMRADHTRDLAWWRMTDWASAMPRMAVTAIVAGVAAGFVAGLLGGFGSGPGGWAAAALIAAVLFGPACGFIYGSGGGTPVQLSSIRWSTLVNWQTAVFGVGIGLVVGLLVGFTIGLGSGVVLGLTVGLVAGLLAGLLLAMSRTSTDERSPISPLTCWRRDRQYGLVYGLTVGLSFGIMFGLLTGLKAGLAYGLLVGLAVGLTFALAVGLTLALIFPEAWPVALTFVQLHRSGGAPVRLMRFLEDAHARHVLRTAGPVYQFRHARLQERLADRYARQLS